MPQYPLARQSYYAVVTAINQAELFVVARSNNVTVDATPPLVDYVRDMFSIPFLPAGGLDADMVGATSMDIGCLFGVRDLESRVESATWCLGTFPGACNAIQPTEITPRLGETEQSVGGLVDGVRYYSLLTVYNYARGIETAISDGFTIDVSPPVCGFISDGPGYDQVLHA